MNVLSQASIKNINSLFYLVIWLITSLLALILLFTPFKDLGMLLMYICCCFLAVKQLVNSIRRSMDGIIFGIGGILFTGFFIIMQMLNILSR
jgi:hypothetical protein